MKKLTRYFAGLVMAMTLMNSRPAHAYFGFDFGLVDDDNFGYGLGFGMYTPDNFGLDFQIISDYEGGTAFNKYWIQHNVSLFYDFHDLVKNRSSRFENAHPYFKLGFAYGMNILTSFSSGGVEYGGRLSDGPGMLFGGGCDWKLGTGASLGIDFYENIIWLDEASAGGIVLQNDHVHWGFNFLMTVKAYDLPF